MNFRTLKPGETIGVLAPGGPVRPDRMTAGVEAIEKLGFKVSCPLDPTKYYGNYAHAFSNGSVSERVSALNTLLDDEEVSVILAARGAFGTIEILPEIDFAKVKASRKVFVGYSDTTNLLLPWAYQAGVCSIHGPTLSKEFAEFDECEDSKRSAEQLIALLSEDNYEFEHSCGVIREGKGQGEILAGNLSVLESLVGTPWDVDYSNRILVVEDIGERPYRTYRSLLHLHHSGKLAKLQGLVFGRFDKCEAANGPTVGEVIEKFVQDYFPKTTYPIISDLPFGHNGLNYGLPLGTPASIDAEAFSYKV